jgi:fructose-1-phosphate kinase PfkB-like protein
LNKALITRGQFLDAVERIQRMGADMAVLSLGNRGAVAFNGEQVYEVIPPRVEAVSPIGAGDALDAAFAWSMSMGRSFADAARWGVAAGTASAMMPGIQFATLEQTQAIYDKVEVKLIER